ncbi:DUF6249 domain-containing protein [Brevundimonas sp. NPDC092305]|jgi:hypothetical protein|uniref:DUF6249 domain-containing protein n=1 Tax=Brevundimonas sp. NPDC092305 TaxID=3363957 RepID=UPI00382A37A2
MDGIMVPISLFAMIAAIVIVPTWLRSRERKEMQASLRASIEKGQQLPPEVIEALTRDNIKPVATAAKDLRVGVIMLALALGIGLTFAILGYNYDDDIFGFGAWAAIPGMIGLAFIILSFFNKNKG